MAGILARLGPATSRSSVQRILDFTRVGGLFRSVRVGAVIDVFSRKVLAIGVVAGRPGACFAVGVLREAISVAGVPSGVVSDRGRQFTSCAFERALRRLGIRRRYGPVGQSGSIALTERFWTA